MSIKLDLNTKPYYDDFDENSEFYKVLFRPGHAIQGRELTTLQTILQNQIEKFGNHVFKEGAMIIPGGSGFNNEAFTIRIKSVYASDTQIIESELAREAFVGSTLTGLGTGIKAEVLAVTFGEEPLIHINYLSSGTLLGGPNMGDSVSDFQPGEALSGVSLGTVNVIDEPTDTEILVSTPSSVASISEGIYYVRGHFIKCHDQTIVVDAFSNKPTSRIGFEITESLVGPEDDISLLDNAQGVSNFAAKGAHRLGIHLNLTSKGLSQTDDTHFVDLIHTRNGEIIWHVEHTDYSLLEETLARRTYDESGNYSVDPFDIEAREHKNSGLNRGIYSDGDSDKLALAMGVGKAYVHGYEIETLATQFVDVDKGRKYKEKKSGIIPASIGNYAIVSHVDMYNSPDITDTNETEAFKVVELHDAQFTLTAAPTTTPIGYARTRAFEKSGDNYKLYLFDVQMVTELTLSGSPTITDGVRIKSSSGATGYVVAPNPAVPSNTIRLIQVSGIFKPNEELEASDNTNLSGVTVTASTPKDFSMVKGVFMDDDVTAQEFRANFELDSIFNLSGTFVTTNSSNSITANNANIEHELRVGDIIKIPSHADPVKVTVISGNTITLADPATISGTFGAERLRAKLNEQEELVSIFKLPKNEIRSLKTDSNQNLTGTDLTVKKQFVATGSNNTVTFSTNINEPFRDISTYGDHYVATNMSDGEVLGPVTSSSTTSITYDTAGAANKCKLIAPIKRFSAIEKSKTKSFGQGKIIAEAHPTIYGRRVEDDRISLDVTDAYAIRGIFESSDIGTAADLPSLTYSSASFNAVPGDKITSESGSIGIVINRSGTTTAGDIEYYMIHGSFIDEEVITRITDNGLVESAEIDNVTSGDIDIKSSFTLDTGQRDSYYDVSSIVRKPGYPIPNGQLKIVFDHYYIPGGGNYFSVDSYIDTDYTDIPPYTATRIDPDVIAPAGEYELRDSLDFRPSVAVAEPTPTTATNPFIFGNRNFTTGASTHDMPISEGLVSFDYEYYLRRIDHLYLTSEGKFTIQRGVDAEIPSSPAEMNDAMKLAEIKIPAYTHSPKDLILTKLDNSRYTMSDIGRLEKRIGNIEYYTSLNMLEMDTQVLQIKDENGFDRFKSGFIVDNFSGHSVGDVAHPDYKCSIDFRGGVLRPEAYIDNVELKELHTQDNQRAADYYQKTGDLITLPYTSEVLISQSLASRLENVNPFAIQSWVGTLKLTPDTDTWIDTKKAVDIIINVEGDYDIVMKREKNNLGNIWNSWRDVWVGNNRNDTNDRWHGNTLVRTIDNLADVNQTRTGVNTTIKAVRENKLAGTKVIDTAIIPFMRSKEMALSVTGMKPLTQIYPFFDSLPVSLYITDSDGNAFSDNKFVTTGAGEFNANFTIPNDDSIRFRVGKKTLRLTDRDDNNLTPGVANTFAEATFESAGTLNTEQSTFMALRNAQITRTDISQDQSFVRRTRTSTRAIAWRDPLAQTFIIDKEGGTFVTKVDIFFGSKDATDLPVSLMIRSVENGIPAKEILPFSEVSLKPDDVNVSLDGLTATTFTFDSPVYLNDKQEYCIVLESNSTDYKCWISQVGEKDINSMSSISEQPYMGVLFKSQNSSTWTSSQMEDLKFTLWNAKFDTSKISDVKLINKPLSDESGHIDILAQNALETVDGSDVIKVHHENHGMYAETSNVVISGATTSGATTIAGIPIEDINKIHTSISNIEIDSYCITVATNATKSVIGGGSAIKVTRNVPYDRIHPIISVMDFPTTEISAKIRGTTSTSLGLSDNNAAYIKEDITDFSEITINEDVAFDSPMIIASVTNEGSKLNGINSFDLDIALSSSNENVSPVIDLSRTSVITIANRIDNINELADVSGRTTYIPSTDPIGDNNPAIYMTKKIALEVPATALRTLLAASVLDSSRFEVYYKTLRSDVTTEFDDISWVPYNDTGLSDSGKITSKFDGDFKSHLYTVNDLPEFIAFSIKIVMKSTISTEVPVIRDFRTIALAL
jgi:hypothetical protein